MVSYNSILGLDVFDGTYSSPLARKDKLHKEEAKNNVNSLFEFDTKDSNIYDTDGLCPFLKKMKSHIPKSVCSPLTRGAVISGFKSVSMDGSKHDKRLIHQIFLLNPGGGVLIIVGTERQCRQ